MQVFLLSLGVVALAEFGDKTQLVVLVLAARHRRMAPILAGVLVAGLLAHGFAAVAGRLVAAAAGDWLRWIAGGAFLAMALWMLKPEAGEAEATRPAARHGPFLATLLALLLLEMGDKTQLATAALAARSASLVPVVLGASLGMLLANLPAVGLGGLAAARLPLKAIRVAAAATFAGIGFALLAGFGAGLGPG